MGQEESIEVYRSDLSRKTFFIDSEAFAALKANNITVDEFTTILFEVSKELSMHRKKSEHTLFTNKDNEKISSDIYWGQSRLTDKAKGLVAKLLKISPNDLSCILSKNFLYSKMLNLNSKNSDSLLETLTDRWFFNFETLRAINSVKIDKNYEIDLNLLDEYENDDHEKWINRDRRVFKNTDGVVYLLSAADIKLLSVADKDAINYFYEDMLKLFFIISKDEELYTSDLFLKYLDI